MFLLETCYYLAVPPSALLLPPPVVEHRQRPLLLQLQDAVRYCLGVRRTCNFTKKEIIIKIIFLSVFLPGGSATPYPLLSSLSPIWVSSQFLSMWYSMEAASMKKA